MKDLALALKDFAQVLDKSSILYAVMGGLAVRFHGIPRPTFDLDLLIAIERSKLPDLYAALRLRGYTIPEPYQSGWVDQVAGLPLVKIQIYLEGKPLTIDLFLCESDFQEQILARRVHAPLENIPVWLISAEDLILLKLLANRPKDLADIGDIVFTQGQLDEAYLRLWADHLDVRARLDSVLEQDRQS